MVEPLALLQAAAIDLTIRRLASWKSSAELFPPIKKSPYVSRWPHSITGCASLGDGGFRRLKERKIPILIRRRPSRVLDKASAPDRGEVLPLTWQRRCSAQGAKPARCASSRKFPFGKGRWPAIWFVE